MDALEIVAAVLGVISSCSFFLQAIKIEKLHESKDVSLPMFSILFINAIVWLTYGLTINNFVIWATYSVTTLATATVIFEYFRYARKKEREKLQAQAEDGGKKPAAEEAI